jgi:hypothetical protein
MESDARRDLNFKSSNGQKKKNLNNSWTEHLNNTKKYTFTLYRDVYKFLVISIKSLF